MTRREHPQIRLKRLQRNFFWYQMDCSFLAAIYKTLPLNRLNGTVLVDAVVKVSTTGSHHTQSSGSQQCQSVRCSLAWSPAHCMFLESLCHGVLMIGLDCQNRQKHKSGPSKFCNQYSKPIWLPAWANCTRSKDPASTQCPILLEECIPSGREKSRNPAAKQ